MTERILYPLLLLLLPLIGRGQTPYKLVDADGYKVSGFLKDGKKDSLWIYKSNGEIDSSGHYRLGEKEGSWYIREGNLDAQGTFERGQRQGVWAYFTRGFGMKKVAYGAFHLGLKTGKWREFDPPLFVEGVYENGKKEGKWELRDIGEKRVGYKSYLNGKLHGEFQNDLPGYFKVEGEFCEEIPCGTWTYRYPNGNIFQEVNHRSNSGDSLIRSSFLSDGTQTVREGNGTLEMIQMDGNIEKGEVRDGIRVGLHSTYNREGDLLKTTPYMNGIIEGVETYYQPLDSMAIIGVTRFKNGKKDGPSTWYYEDGSRQSESYFKNGVNHGPVRWWACCGENQVILSGNYENGKATGKWTKYYPSGKTKEIATYAEGILSDTLRKLDESGKIIQLAFFSPQKSLWEVHDYFPAGHLSRKYHAMDPPYKYSDPDLRPASWAKKKKGSDYGPFTRWSDTMITYHSNGEKSSLRVYRNNERNGTFWNWDSLGNLTSSSKYADNVAQGEYLTFFSNEKKKKECIYYNGYLSGPGNEWYENGQKMKESFFDYGLADSAFRYWNDTGELLVMGQYEKGQKDGWWSYFVDGYEWQFEYLKDEEQPASVLFYPSGEHCKITLESTLPRVTIRMFYRDGSPHFVLESYPSIDLVQSYWNDSGRQTVIDGEGKLRLKASSGKAVKLRVEDGRTSKPRLLEELVGPIVNNPWWVELKSEVRLIW